MIFGLYEFSFKFQKTIDEKRAKKLKQKFLYKHYGFGVSENCLALCTWIFRE